MSLIKLQGNASGTGAFTIAAPNSNTDRTLTLPDATGTVNVSGLANEVPAGSAGAPAIYPTGDTNTGIFFPAADTVGFSAGGTERVRIDANGIKFNGNTAAANALDGYEEGTWTPTVATEGGTGYTLSSSAGYYTKVGNLVCVEAAITFTAEGSGSITFISLPFAPATNTEILSGLVTQGTNNRSIQLQHYAGATVLVRFDDGTAYINYWTPTSGWAPTNTFVFSGTYRTT